MEYASHVMNILSSTVIGGKLRWIFGWVDLLKTIVCLRVFDVRPTSRSKTTKLNLRAKKFVF